MEELPPGYRFFPTEEELVSFYLINKLEGNRQELHRVIPVIRLYEIEPWHLPSTALILLLYLFCTCCMQSYAERNVKETPSNGFSSRRDKRGKNGAGDRAEPLLLGIGRPQAHRAMYIHPITG